MRRPKPGDRIEVIDLINDPAPLEIGTTGTVERISDEGGRLEQCLVKWDTDRSLILVPQDYSCITVIEGTDRSQKESSDE